MPATPNPLDHLTWKALWGVIAAFSVVFYVTYGLITGNWTDDQENHRSCTTVHMTQLGQSDYRVCTDNETGEIFTLPGG